MYYTQIVSSFVYFSVHHLHRNKVNGASQQRAPTENEAKKKTEENNLNVITIIRTIIANDSLL